MSPARACLPPALVLLLALALTACGSAGESPGPGRELRPLADAVPGTWTRLPDLPLPPRGGPVVATVDGRVVVVGGYDRPCPPTADCGHEPAGERRDGAVHDPVTSAWAAISKAPRSVPAWSSSAVLGTDLYVLADGELLVWHARTDTWEVVAHGGPLEGALVADGHRLLVVRGSDERGERPDLVLEPATGAWEEVVDDPFDAVFDRTLTRTPYGLVLTAHSIATLDRGGPVLVRAAVLPHGETRWRDLGKGDLLGGDVWSWDGRHVLSLVPGGSDGGEVDNFGRTVPYGGRLDPRTGRWSQLPQRPGGDEAPWPVEAGSSGSRTASGGWLLDGATDGWTALARPAGAPEQPGPAVWLGDTVVVVGGEDWADGGAAGGRAGTSSVGGPEDVWPSTVWAWRAE